MGDEGHQYHAMEFLMYAYFRVVAKQRHRNSSKKFGLCPR